MKAAAGAWRRRHWLGGLLGLACAPAQARSGVRLSVAYPPGGLSDEVARELAARLGARLGRPVSVEHRPGAGGALALEALARAPADEALLCFAAIAPLLQAAGAAPLRFDPRRDIAPVAAVMQTPVLVAATPAFAGASLADAVAAARRLPGALRWASSGQATTGHRVIDAVAAAAGVVITHVPYSGGGRQISDALAGHFELLSTNVAARQLGYLREGRLRALGVGAPQRLAVLPEVPTLAELGFPSANLSSLFGLFASGRLDAARLDRWQADIAAVLAQPDFRQRLVSSGNLPLEGTRQDFAQRIAAAAAALRDTAPGGPPR